MGLNVSDKGGGDFEVVPAGQYYAQCYRVIDLGTVHDERWNKEKHQVLISWELLGTQMESDEERRPFTIHNRYTASLSDKALLRKDLVAWRGRNFTAEELENFLLSNVVGAPCLMQVIHKAGTGKSQGKTFANIGSMMPVPPGTALPPAVNPQVVFNLDTPDPEVFKGLSEGLQKRIAQSKEYQALTAGTGELEPPHLTDEQVAAQVERQHQEAERAAMQAEAQANTIADALGMDPGATAEAILPPATPAPPNLQSPPLPPASPRPPAEGTPF